MEKVNEKINQLNEEIEQLNSDLLESKKALNDAQTEVQQYEAKLADLKLQLIELIADKERWFKLVEEEKRIETRNSTLVTALAPIQGTLIYLRVNIRYGCGCRLVSTIKLLAGIPFL
jgi:predicted  nucleic acid-binding Zn-ribbon protein